MSQKMFKVVQYENRMTLWYRIGAFFLWKSSGCGDIIIGILCRVVDTRGEG